MEETQGTKQRLLESSFERYQIFTHVELICGRYGPWKKLPEDIKELLVTNIERSCYNKTIEECTVDGIDRVWSNKAFLERYSTNCYKVLSNLDKNSSIKSIELLDKVINNEINVLKIAYMTSHEMQPSVSKEIFDDIELRKQQKINQKVSTSHTCPKCKVKSSTFLDAVTRCADEATRKNLKCTNCGHSWMKG